MGQIPNSTSRTRPRESDRPSLGLFRREPLDSGPIAGTVTRLFADLRQVSRGELIAEHPERHLQGTRVLIDRAQGYGTWELYRLDQDFYLVGADGTYDAPRVETVPGEGLVEFHLRLSGVLQMTLPGVEVPMTVEGPKLLMMYQPPGVEVSERVTAGLRDCCVSLYCRPQFLAELARRNGIPRWPLLEAIERHGSTSVWHRQEVLSPTLLYIGRSLLESPYRRGIRLLHAEAKALELLCEMLAGAQEECASNRVTSEIENRQLDEVRRLLKTNLSKPLKLFEIARAVGMSESKLKRAFKARYGFTVYDFGLDCRMRQALELLRCHHMSVCQVAYAIGYRHQTSFATAFNSFFGFPPSKARTQMH